MNDINTRPAAELTAETEPEAIPNIARVPMSFTPQRDLWPGIDSRIRAKRRAPLWAAAAGVAAVSVLALGAVADRHRALLSEEPVVAATAPIAAPAEVALATRPVRSAQLLPVVSQPLHSEARALVRANLKIVNKAESQVQHALRQDPDDAYLHNLLAATRQQKAALRVALAEDGQ